VEAELVVEAAAAAAAAVGWRRRRVTALIPRAQQTGTRFTNNSTIFLSFFYLFSKSLLNNF
jgi:hypothetical protein